MKPVEVELAIMVIQRRKRAANIVPDHALMVADIFKELKKNAPDDIRAALRELTLTGRVIYHPTANDVAFEIKDGIKSE